jgi:hypothetical protein
MDVLLNEPQDRIVMDVWGWVTTDPKTGLESLCGAKIGGDMFQAVSTSKATILKLEPLIRRAEQATGKRVELVRFVREGKS